MRARASTLEVLGPLRADRDADWTRRIQSFREDVYTRRRMDHLLGEETGGSFDARATHFVLLCDGRLAGCVRLIPAPFEAAALLPALARACAPLGRHVEISRLVVEVPGSLGEATTALLQPATRWAHGQGFAGIVAVCRGATAAALFAQRGLSPVAGPYALPSREGQPYYLLAGGWQAVEAPFLADQRRRGIPVASVTGL